MKAKLTDFVLAFRRDIKMDYIQDKKITQDEAGRLQAPMELDLIALFKVLEMDVKEMLENNDQSPDALIDDILRLFSTEGGEVR